MYDFTIDEVNDWLERQVVTFNIKFSIEALILKPQSKTVITVLND